MKVIKKINNNIAIAVDEENNEFIVFAKLGYGNIPYRIKDLSVIELEPSMMLTIDIMVYLRKYQITFLT